MNTVKVTVLLRVDDEEPRELGSVLLTGPEQITSGTAGLLRTVADAVEAKE